MRGRFRVDGERLLAESPLTRIALSRNPTSPRKRGEVTLNSWLTPQLSSTLMSATSTVPVADSVM